MTSQTFSIRRATIKDVDALMQLRIELFYEVDYRDGCNVSPEVIDANRDYLMQNIPLSRFVAWIAEFEGRVIGISGLIFFEKPPTRYNRAGLEAYIMNMYTVPEWRGKGIATSLLREIIRFVQSMGAKRLWLHTTEDGQSVYEKQGFTLTEHDMELTW